MSRVSTFPDPEGSDRCLELAVVGSVRRLGGFGRLAEAAVGWAGEKLVLTELEGRFRDARFCCARSNDGASDRSFPPLAKGGQGGWGGRLGRRKRLFAPRERDAGGAKVRGHERAL